MVTAALGMVGRMIESAESAASFVRSEVDIADAVLHEQPGDDEVRGPQQVTYKEHVALAQRIETEHERALLAVDGPPLVYI